MISCASCAPYQWNMQVGLRDKEKHRQDAQQHQQRQKQAQAAMHDPVFKCTACAGTPARDEQYSREVLEMHHSLVHAPVQYYHVQPAEHDHIVQAKGTATELDDTQYNRKQLLGRHLQYIRATDMISTGSLDQAGCQHALQVEKDLRAGLTLRFFECSACRDFYRRRDPADQKGTFKQYRFCKQEELLQHCEDEIFAHRDKEKMKQQKYDEISVRWAGVGAQNHAILNSAPIRYQAQAQTTNDAKTDAQTQQARIDNRQHMNSLRVNKIDVPVFVGANAGVAALAECAMELVKIAIMEKHGVII